MLASHGLPSTEHGLRAGVLLLMNAVLVREAHRAGVTNRAGMAVWRARPCSVARLPSQSYGHENGWKPQPFFQISTMKQTQQPVMASTQNHGPCPLDPPASGRLIAASSESAAALLPSD